MSDVFRLLFMAWVALLICSPPRARYRETAVRHILFSKHTENRGDDRG
jgi:hypothetical protein